MVTDFLDRSDAIEESYEFMLAYAGQGVTGEEGSEVHRFLSCSRRSGWSRRKLL